MAGRLEFAASASWGAAPRARFNGFYTIAKRGCGCFSAGKDVEWLFRFMDAAPPSRYKRLAPRTDEPLILYTDALGHPKKGFGAVLMDGDSVLWTKAACPEYLLESLADRATQIQPRGGLRRHPRPLDVQGRDPGQTLLGVHPQPGGPRRHQEGSVPRPGLQRARLLHQVRLR